MGTSNLYGGPKKTVLLPMDYNPYEGQQDETPEENPSEGETPENDSPMGEAPEAENSNEEGPSQSVGATPSVTWREARRSVTHAMNHRLGRTVKRAIRNYTKALGGHSHATRQARQARRTAGVILNYFSGTPEVIRARFEEAGIRFDGRPTKDILNDIYLLLSPIPNDLEDSLANMAIDETIADVAMDASIDLNEMECFNEKLLQSLVGGFMKHYIFDKLIQQSEQGALKGCDNISKIRELEKSIKRYIDGIVDGVVPDIVHSGLDSKDFNRAVDTLFDVAYQQMEELI